MRTGLPASLAKRVRVATIPLALVLAGGGLVLPSGAEGDWETDFAEAKTAASRERKDLFVLFTGSDWCPVCLELHRTVFAAREFQEQASRDFVLVQLDFPAGKTQPAPIREQNRRLQTAFGVRGLPSMFLADAAGIPYAEIACEPGIAAGEFISRLHSFRTIRERRDREIEKAEPLEGEKRAEQLAKALETMDDDIAGRFYGALADELVALDDSDKWKWKKRRAFQRKFFPLEAAVFALANDGDGSAIEPKIDQFLAENPLADAERQRVLLLKLGLFGPGDTPAALALLDKIVALDGKSRFADQARAIRRRLAPDS